jgi:hypothetical protein
MAATVKYRHNKVILTAIDADWTHIEETTLYGFSFQPGSANDICVIKYTSDTGDVIYKAFSASLATETVTFPKPFKALPMVDYSACTLNTGHQLTLYMDRLSSGGGVLRSSASTSPSVSVSASPSNTPSASVSSSPSASVSSSVSSSPSASVSASPSASVSSSVSASPSASVSASPSASVSSSVSASPSASVSASPS